MHRHLFQVYSETEDNSSLIHQATRLFRSLLQGADADKMSSSDSVLTDVIAEYLIDTKLYTRSDYQPEKARDLLSHAALLSSSIETYLLETIRPNSFSLRWMQRLSFSNRLMNTNRSITKIVIIQSMYDL